MAKRRIWLLGGAVSVGAWLVGCGSADPASEDWQTLESPLVTTCTTDVECGSGYVCTTGNSCVRPANCYYGASGLGVISSLTIDATDTSADIQALNGAWCVAGDLSVKNTSIVDLTGLGSLVAVAGNINIQDNPNLTSLQGLDGLRRAGKLALFRNASLASLSAVSRLSSLGSLQVYINPKLTNLNGLQSVTFISYAEIVNNAGLTSLNGLGSIAGVYSYIDVRLNPLLTDVAGLDQITSVGNLVQVTDNPSLNSLRGLGNLTTIGSTLRVLRNGQLQSFSALGKLTRTTTFQVADNAKLDSCGVTELASRLGADCSGCVRNGPCPPPDYCPDDPAKLESGICGCGVADLDTDRDGKADCVDPCPQDAPNDSDDDGVCNSSDQCPGFDDRVDADANAVPDACQECVTAADCDDGNACTTDACSATHCEHTAQSGTGCGSHGTCSNDAECIEPRCRFVPLGFASFTGTRVSEAYAVSDDGTTVTGRVGSVETMAFRWREATGMVELGWETAKGLTISVDGSRIAGESRPSSVSFRERDGEFTFSDYYSYVYAGSSDGRVLAGKYGSVPMRWVEGGAIEILGTDGAHDISSQTPFGGGSASGVSADGSIIVGGGIFPGRSAYEAFIWRADVPARSLGTLTNLSGSSSYAADISSDGRIVVGTSQDSGSDLPTGFRWSEATGMQSLGTGFRPAAVADSGMVVGTGSDGYAAVIGSSLGDGNLRTLLADCGVDMTGWLPVRVNDVTADGKTLVGVSYDPAYNYQAMLVTLP